VLRQNPSNAAEAEKCFEQALKMARKQRAMIFELRTAASLVWLLVRQNHRDEAHSMLAEIYHWFTEGH